MIAREHAGEFRSERSPPQGLTANKRVQGWDIKVEPGRFTEEKPLRVIVMPHSHTGPRELMLAESVILVNDRGAGGGR